MKRFLCYDDGGLLVDATNDADRALTWLREGARSPRAFVRDCERREDVRFARGEAPPPVEGTPCDL